MRKTEIIAAWMAIAAITATAQDPGDPPSRVARLNYMSGNISFRPGTVDEWAAATLNYPLYRGDHLWADRDSRAELHVGSTAMRIGSETALAVLNLDDRMVQLSLTNGALIVRLRSLGDSESFEVDTPNGAVTLLRPGEYRFYVDGDRNLSDVIVRGGDAEVTAAGRAISLHARDIARLSGVDDTFRGELDQAPPPDEFEAWCQSRDRREEQSQSVRHVSREMIGYEDLDENGVWREVPEYGWVWAPRVAVGWAPYHYGRWAWVEPWGWTWVDDAPWGFAPFHYGRWANAGGAWVWVPGTMVARPVYAPALVAFVGGPRFSVSLAIGGGAGVAWFPLGPHEVYRPAYHVSDVYVRQVNVTHVNVTNINVTNVNVTNVNYVNRNVQGAVTAVPQSAFVSARPVHTAAVPVSANAVAQAQVVGTAAPVAPERASVLGRAQGTPGVAPPARIANREVVAKTAPPPPPVSFAARRDALQANPGRPLDPSTAESLRRNDRSVRAPMVRQAPPAAPAAPMAPSMNRPPVTQPVQQPPMRENASPRNDRPRPMNPATPQNTDMPRREPRVQESQPRPITPVTPRNNEPPRREQRVQESQPRPNDRPRTVAPQNSEPPRREVNQERNEQRKTENRKAQRKDDKKDERKQ